MNKDQAIVAAALDWAYRQSYTDGEKAAEAFARLQGLKVVKRDLGMWGDKIEFEPAPPAFDPALVTMERKRFSTTQGEVAVSYDGALIAQYGDRITLQAMGYEGLPDSYWIDVAKRYVELHGAPPPPTVITHDFRHTDASALAGENDGADA